MADARIDELAKKWSDRFNKLEALDKLEPPFHPVKVTPMHTPPVGAVKATEPFIRPTDRPQQATNRPAPSDLSGTNHPATRRQVTSKLSRNHQQD